MNLKSIVARVTRRPARDGKVPLKVYGAVWHNDARKIQGVEVRLDEGPWRAAQVEEAPQSDANYCWRFFSLDLGAVPAGKHQLVSRALDVDGHVQPAADDDEIALKKTYWEAYQQWPREIEVSV
jgi:sulfite oxidase